MFAYIIRRLILIVPTLFGIMVVNFLVIQAAPGGPVEQMIARIKGTVSEATARVSGADQGDVSASRGKQGATMTGDMPSKYRGARGLDPEIIKEMTYALQECGRRLSVYLKRRRRQAEQERKRNYIELYLPHVALGLQSILDLNDREETAIVKRLHKMLERTHLEI